MSKLVVTDIEDAAGVEKWNNTLGTPVDTSTGAASYSITGIPSGVKRADILLNDVDLSGADEIVIQLGDAGGIETSGYTGSCAFIANTVVKSLWSSSIILTTSRGASNNMSGIVTLILADPATNKWTISGNIGRTDSADMYVLAGDKSLSSELTQLLILDDGASTFDGGTVNIQYSF